MNTATSTNYRHFLSAYVAHGVARVYYRFALLLLLPLGA
jgi:hypothetical protein